METEDLFDLAIGILGARRAPAAAAVRVARPARSVRRVPGVHPARSLQHREPRAGRPDPARGARRRRARLDAAAERVAARAGPLHHPPAARTPSPATTTWRRSRRASSRRSAPGTDDLREALIEEHGEEDGIKLFRRYERAFPPGYRSDWVARSAVADIGRIEELASTDEPITSLYRPLEAPEGIVRLQAVQRRRRAPVGGAADARAPRREGRRRASVRDHAGRPRAGVDLRLRPAGATPRTPSGSATCSTTRSSACGAASSRTTALNGLVLGATLTGRQVSIIRAIAKYLRQGGIGFSDAYMRAHADSAIPRSSGCWSRLFDARLDPDDARRATPPSGSASEIEEALDAVPSLDEDRILRSFLSVVRAIVRTNYFQTGARRQRRTRTCRSSSTPRRSRCCPLPRPQFEIFVYSPRVEARPSARRQGGPRRPALVGPAARTSAPRSSG